MLFHQEPVYKNISISVLGPHRAALAEAGGRAGHRRAAMSRPADPSADGRSTLLGTLSGGNQQKVALAKWLT